MNRLLPVLFFSCFVYQGFSQDKSTAFDFEGSKQKRLQLIDKRLRIGYGLQVPLVANSNVYSTAVTPYTDAGWLGKNPTQILDVGFMFGFRENWTFGLTMTNQRLGISKEEFRYQPGADAVGNYTLRTFYNRLGRAYGNTLYAERRLYSSYNDRFRLFSRIDIGFNRYSVVAKIKYYDNNDTCNCNRTLLTARSGTAVFATDLGVGMQYLYHAIGIKFSIGYRIQTSGKLILKDELDSWQYVFKEDEYNFSGDPDKNLFSINRPAVERADVMHQRLYAQFSMIYVLGKRDYPYR